jgi:hypothetical protein
VRNIATTVSGCLSWPPGGLDAGPRDGRDRARVNAPRRQPCVVHSHLLYVNRAIHSFSLTFPENASCRKSKFSIKQQKRFVTNPPVQYFVCKQAIPQVAWLRSGQFQQDTAQNSKSFFLRCYTIFFLSEEYI